MSSHLASIWQSRRVLFHLLLAVFLANAANKFFIGDLEYEQEHQFYERIFEFRGDAPDQYRILPLLAIKSIRNGLRLLRPETGFNHAVLLFNFICGFLLFECFFSMLRHRPERQRYLFNLFFALAYIYTQYTGWRPDTLGLLLIGSLYTWWLSRSKAASSRSDLFLHLLFISAMAFSRSDIAAIYAVFFSFSILKNWGFRIFLMAIPFAVQWLLQFYLFKDASYYTKPVMIWDNLSGYYLLINPATWLIAAIFLLFYQDLKRYFLKSYRVVPAFYWLLFGYLALVFVAGRLNEYRLYLPFLPLWILVDQKVILPLKDSIPINNQSS